MTKKYFYTCPIKALYMRRYFNVQFEPVCIVGEPGKIIGDPFSSFHAGEEFCIQFYPILGKDFKFYVAPESEHIFRFRSNDFVKAGWCEYDFYHNVEQKNFVNEILRRESKQFFMPEIEE